MEQSESSHKIARALAEAFAIIKLDNGSVGSYIRAWKIAEPFVDAPMSPQQASEMYFLRAMAYAAVEDYQRALHWLDEALTLAYPISSVNYLVELLYQRASLHRAISHFAEAAEDLREYLRLIDERYRESDGDAIEARLRALPNLAIYEYFTLQLDAAQEHAAAARALLAQRPDMRLEAATVAWAQAQLDLLRGDPQNAFLAASEVSAIYEEQDSAPVSRARAESLAAQAILAMVERLSDGPDRDYLLKMGLSHIERATEISAAANDLSGEGLGLILQAHYSRLAGTMTDRIVTIEAAIQLGRKLADIALISQGLTALAQEHYARGEIDEAVARCNEAIEVISKSEMPVLAMPARRILWQLREQRTDDDHPTGDESAFP